MLTVIEYGKEEYGFPALLVLGCFDAIHSGHRELLKKAKLQAKINGLDLGVMMFKDGKGGKLLYSFEERVAMLEQFNVKFVLAVDFNDEFKKIAPLDFLAAIDEQINVKAYMSGKDFRFGAGAKGKSSTLKSYAEDEENGVWYQSVKDVVDGSDKVSTTLIKSCLDEGNVVRANELLGSEFSLTGEVIHGEGRGSSVVGFPTLNVVYPEWKHALKHGVYGVKCRVGEFDYSGIANFGPCPTFNDDRIILEVYLDGFNGDLYGQVVTVRFIDYIRDIEQFDSPEKLSEQLAADLQTVEDETVVTDETEVVEEQAEEDIEEQPVEEQVEEVTEQPAEEELVVTDETEVAEEQPEEVIEAEQTVEEETVVTDEAEVAEEQPEEVIEAEQTVEEETAVTDETEVAEAQDEEVIEDEQPVEDETVVADETEVVEEIPDQPEAVIEEVAEQTEEISEEVSGQSTEEQFGEEQSAEEETTEEQDDGESEI